MLNFAKSDTPTYERHIYLYDKGDYVTFSRELAETKWDALKNDDIDAHAINITRRITDHANKYIPNKTVKIRSSDPPWLTNSIKRLMRKRKRLYDKYKKSKSIIDFNNYKNIRNQVTCEIRKSKKAEITNLAEKLENPNTGQKDWWNTLKRFIKPDQKSTIPPLYVDDAVYSDGVDKANKPNDFFTEQTVLDESNTSLPPLSDLQPFKFDSISVSSDEVTSVLASLNIGKASGPDSINNRLLKELAQPLTLPLKDLFNYSLAIGKVPSIWKQANVSPIYKKDDPSVVSNFLVRWVRYSRELHINIFLICFKNTIL